MTSGAGRAEHRRRFLRLGIVLLLFALLLSLPRLWRFSVAAALVIDTVRAGETSLLSHLGPAPLRIGTQAPGIAGPTPTDLYLPGAGYPRQVILLVHGVNETGKDDERIVALASNLARARCAVFVPDFPNLRRLRVSPSDAEAVVLAYLDLTQRFSETCRQGQPRACGLLSFSYGVGPGLIAAADARIRDQIGFLVAFGGYADLREVIHFVTTGRASDPRVKAEPYPWAKWAFLAADAGLVEDAADRARLQEIARRKLVDENADVEELSAELGPEARAVWSLMTNRDPGRTEILLQALSPPIRRTIAQLSPLSRLPDVRARLLLAHGVEDRSIPFTESERLAEAAPGRARLLITRMFGHVDPARPPRRGLSALWFNVSEAWRMIRFTNAILGQA